ncbi:hypothetical protein [Nocardia asiatica]|uniref:hypothetical protein n=1 Tax=Nocardia asiatica TaxID=209252 RepID=UPI002454A26E|nr:hypothetical protein [Nocardia asiatica]
MRQAFAMYNAVVGVLLLFAAIMAAALLINAMSPNIGERLGELGALRAAEFDEELPVWARPAPIRGRFLACLIDRAAARRPPSDAAKGQKTPWLRPFAPVPVHSSRCRIEQWSHRLLLLPSPPEEEWMMPTTERRMRT